MKLQEAMRELFYDKTLPEVWAEAKYKATMHEIRDVIKKAKKWIRIEERQLGKRRARRKIQKNGK